MSQRMLLDTARNQGDPDYYFMLSPFLGYSVSGWILQCMHYLFTSHTKIDNVGIVALTSNPPVAVSGYRSQQLSTLVFHRQHMEMFHTVYAEVEAAGLSALMQQHLWIEVYHALNPIISWRGLHFSQQLYGQWTQSISYQQHLAALQNVTVLTVYMELVEKCRSRLVSYLNRHIFPEAPLLWSRSDLVYADGLYVDPYLKVAPGYDPSYAPTRAAEAVPIMRRNKGAKIAFITAIFGSYELSTKKFARQTLPADFICFTDNPRINRNGWIVDTTQYHEHFAFDSREGEVFRNSVHANTHPMSIAKFYKLQFHRIPRLAQYDVVVWLDGTLTLMNRDAAAMILNTLITVEDRHPVIVFEHERTSGELYREVEDSMRGEKYNSTDWQGIPQPLQNVTLHYEAYLQDGYSEEFWRDSPHAAGRRIYGLWVTALLGWNMHHRDTRRFLDLWYIEVLRHTTQDQVSFPYVIQKYGIYPHTLPDDKIIGHVSRNLLFVKMSHGL